MLDRPDRMVAEPVREFHLLRRLLVDVVHEAGVMRATPLKLVLQRKFHRPSSVKLSGVSCVRARGGLCSGDSARGFPRMNLVERVTADQLDRFHNAIVWDAAVLQKK